VRTGAWVLLVIASVVAAVAANYVLLDYGRQGEDPVGRLTPRLASVLAGAPGIDKPPPARPPEDDDHGDGHEDDD
jgi:hypothetical protein